MGRMKKPLALVRLEGNKGKRKLPKPEQEVREPAGTPDCPDWLLPEAKAEWGRLVPYLVASRLFTHFDRGQFAAYCQTWARWRAAETQKGTKVPVSRALEYVRELRQQAREFGLTPSARARLVLPAEMSNDEMGDLISGTGG